MLSRRMKVTGKPSDHKGESGALSRAPAKKSIWLKSISDIHLGNRRNSASEIIKNLRRAVDDNPETAKLDIIFLAGDVFDTLLNLPDDHLSEIDAWIKHLLTVCVRYDILLRIVEGTPSHDWKQSRRFVDINELWGIGCNLKYFDDLDIEYIPEIDRHVIYVPDQHASTTDKTLAMAQDLMMAKGLDQVDIAIMHGHFEYQLPPAAHSQPKHDAKAWCAMVREIICIGHDHHHSRFEKIVSQGSFDRLTHGEEEPKGHIEAHLLGDGTAQITFIENEGAKQFISIDVTEPMDMDDLVALVNRRVKDLPISSHIRLLVRPDHPLLKARGFTQQQWPEFYWDPIKVVADKEEEVETELAEVPAFNAIAITKDNLKTLLLERYAKSFPTAVMMEHASMILDEVI